MGAPRALALCHNFGGALDFQTGRWDEAEESLRSAIELYRKVGSASGESLSLQRLAVLLTARGELDTARDLLVEGIAVAERAAMRSHCLTRLYASLLRNRLAAGDEDEIHASLDDGLEAARRHGHCVTCNALLLPEVVRALLARGETETAARYAAELEQTATEFQSRAWTAMANHARGRVQLAQRELDDAIASFEAASRAYREIEQAYDAARCAKGLAAALRARGGKGDARRAGKIDADVQQILADIGAPGIEE